MKIGLGYSYLNAEKETPRALDPWYDHVDHIIAIDGRYKTPLPPDLRKKYKSLYSTDNTEHILKTRYGDKLTFLKYYATQMDKRQRCLDIAGELGCDYLIVWDSDDYIHPDYQDWHKFNKQLESVLKYWDDRILYMWAWIPDEKLWSKQHNEIPSNIWRQYSRIHKDPGTMRYAQTHWTWASKDTTDDTINKWKWTNPRLDEIKDNPYYLQSNVTVDGIRLTTDRTLRSQSDLEFGDGWAYQQIHWEAFNYKLVPYLKSKGVKCIGMDVPMEKFYFKPAGKIGDEEAGQIVLLNDDGTETLTHQEYHIDPQVDTS
jgi:hypothetical protein